MKILSRIDDLVGGTPLLRLKRIEQSLNLEVKLVAKLEYLNPAGSVKDRIAKAMLDDAENKGVIKQGGVIIEPTSGNTGIGLASIGVARGYKVILTMPDTMSKERIELLKAYGAKVVLTDGTLGMKGAIDKAEELQKQTPNSFIPSQFTNFANPNAHYLTTAKEIIEDTDGKVDIFVAGIGSAGTISGTGKGLKEYNQNIEVVGVEPENSPLITKGTSGKHAIQGIGANFIPKILDTSVIDRVETASDSEAIEYANLIAKREGVLVGISSGASLSVAVRIAREKKNKGKTIVVIFPDTGDRYLSTGIYGEKE